MADRAIPDYAVFDDYRYGQRITVMVRWFLIGVWLTLHNYRPEINEDFFALNGMVLSLAALNAYVHWRIWMGRPVTWRNAFALSGMDLLLLTVGIGVANAFGNNFFVLYYPALLGLSLVANSWRLSLAVVSVVAVAYVLISLTVGEGVDISLKEEKVLGIRIAAMFAVVAASNLIYNLERERRREAVDAERARARENLELQREAQEAELAAQAERDRIAREIHDGIAQSIYALSLNLETCAEVADRERASVAERLRNLVPLAKKTLLEIRHYIYDLKPLLSGESGLKAMAENQVKEFRVVSGTSAHLSTTGEPRDVSIAVASGLYRILQEALANVLKHADASMVTVALDFQPALVSLSVEDNGAGFDAYGAVPGFGLENMRQRVAELAGNFDISGAPGGGTKIGVTLPTPGGAT